MHRAAKWCRQPHPMAHVELRPSIVRHGIVLVRNKADVCSAAATTSASTPTTSATGSQVAVGIVERVKTKEREFGADAGPEIRDQLVLPEYSFGVVLIDVVVTAKRPDGITDSPREGRLALRRKSWCSP